MRRLRLGRSRSPTEVLDTLARHPDAGVPVLHWFSGTKVELQRAVAMGCWFSVGPAMVLGKRGRDLLTAMPRDRVLTETDGPLATIGDKPLGPGEVAPACKALAACWGVGSDEAAAAVLAAFRRLTSSSVGGPAAIA